MFVTKPSCAYCQEFLLRFFAVLSTLNNYFCYNINVKILSELHLKSKLWETCQKRKFKVLKNTISLIHNWPDLLKMNKILQYQSILKTPWSLLVQPVELFSARIYGQVAGQVIFSIQTRCIPLEAFASKNRLEKFNETSQECLSPSLVVHVVTIFHSDIFWQSWSFRNRNVLTIISKLQ